jgi:prepilin-type N-terminal cleavage/methylation domain-containing protein
MVNNDRRAPYFIPRKSLSDATGYTLIELLVVVMIVGILAGLAFKQFVETREKGFDKEVQANLAIIQAGEKNYLFTFGNFTSCGSVANCNQQLGLDIPNRGIWNYSVTSGYCIDAWRINHARRDWHISLVDSGGNLLDSVAQPCDCSGGNCR